MYPTLVRDARFYGFLLKADRAVLAEVETIAANRGRPIVASAGGRGFRPWLETGDPCWAA